MFLSDCVSVEVCGGEFFFHFNDGKGRETSDRENSHHCRCKTSLASSRRLSLSRLKLVIVGQGKDNDEPRSPIAVRSLYEWEKSLLEHLRRELFVRWATEPSSLLVEGGVETEGDKGNPWASGRRGVVATSLDRLDDDGCMRTSQEVRGGCVVFVLFCVKTCCPDLSNVAVMKEEPVLASRRDMFR